LWSYFGCGGTNAVPVCCCGLLLGMGLAARVAEQADVITGIVGNVISGQVTGSTAKTLSENFGKISQAKDSMSINSSDTSTTKATQMDYAIPASKIATLSSGEFVGVVADNPGQKIKLKMFHAEIQNDHVAMAREEGLFQEIPMVKVVTAEMVEENYKQIKRDIFELLKVECGKLSVKPEVKEGVKKRRSRPRKVEGEEQSVSY
ncbi:MAG: hypothetical protein ACQUHE_03390, partial [Bacteroidia bacterium]